MTDDEERPERLDRVGVDVDGMEEVGGTGMMVCGVTVALSPAAVGNTGMVAIISESFRWGSWKWSTGCVTRVACAGG